MTHFEKPDHKYHRVIFEFTDKEIKDAGYYKLRFNPTKLEILRVLQRMADKDKKQLDVPWVFSTRAPEIDQDGKAEIDDSLLMQCGVAIGIPKTIHRSTPGGSFSKEAYLSELEETMKQFSREDHADLQRKKDAWKAKALRLIDFLNNKDKLIERLLRENKHYRDTMTQSGL